MPRNRAACTAGKFGYSQHFFVVLVMLRRIIEGTGLVSGRSTRHQLSLITCATMSDVLKPQRFAQLINQLAMINNAFQKNSTNTHGFYLYFQRHQEFKMHSKRSGRCVIMKRYVRYTLFSMQRSTCLGQLQTFL